MGDREPTLFIVGRFLNFLAFRVECFCSLHNYRIWHTKLKEIIMKASKASRKLRVRLIHWHEAEAAERASRLRGLGYQVDHAILSGPEGFRELRDNPPSAFVIDLSRVPSHGRDVGIALRSYKDTRLVPIVFVDGDPEKVDKLKTYLPDAVYTEWPDIGKALKQAVSRPVVAPAVPRSRMEAYSGSPLPKKLGIRPGTAVILVGGPEGFRNTLGKLPDRVSVGEKSIDALPKVSGSSRAKAGERRLILWFVKTQRELERDVGKIAARTPDGGVWIIWPKKASGLPSDLNQNIVRAAGLGAGVVDYKVCAVDETWSGLLFARRK
jgi:CheY-like chemotaxis protein